MDADRAGDGGGVRVLVVDDHPVFRAGLRALLDEAPGIGTVLEAGDGEDALALAVEQAPDVVVLDVEMAGLGGVEVARRLAAADPSPAVLVLSAHDAPAYVEDLLACGVAGYLTKSESEEDIVRAVRDVARGVRGWLSRGVAARLMALTRRREREPRRLLSERELEVLGLLADGLGNKQIAARLGLSTHTVKNHLANIYPKLGVQSRVEAVLWLRDRQASGGAGA